MVPAYSSTRKNRKNKEVLQMTARKGAKEDRKDAAQRAAERLLEERLRKKKRRG